jgi:hypothetical protein
MDDKHLMRATRRTVLAGIAATLAPAPLAAPSWAAGAATKPYRVDLHHHILPPNGSTRRARTSRTIPGDRR